MAGLIIDRESGQVYAPMDVANAFIRMGLEKNQPVTHMKLHKLLYYAQGYYLAQFDQRLFNGAFKKWQFGPVCPGVYKVLKTDDRLLTNVSAQGKDVTDPDDRAYLESIWKRYGQYSGMQLSKLSHSETPWIEAEINDFIPDDSIKSYFIGLLENTRSTSRV